MQPAGVSVITVWTCCNFLPHLNRGTLRSVLGKLNVCPWRVHVLGLPLRSSGLLYYHQVNILSRKLNHFISPQTLHASVFFMMRQVWEFKGGNNVNDMKSSFPKRDKRQIKKKWVCHAILLRTEPTHCSINVSCQIAIFPCLKCTSLSWPHKEAL